MVLCSFLASSLAVANLGGKANANSVPCPASSPERNRNRIGSRTFGPTPCEIDETFPSHRAHHIHETSWKLTTFRETTTRAGGSNCRQEMNKMTFGRPSGETVRRSDVSRLRRQ